jgi:signal transduction histidine kinase
MTEQLKRLDQLKTDFMAMTAHDLRTPLTSIAGFASLLSEEWPGLTEDDRRGMVDHITTAASRLGEFIENMLQFARIESGELSYDIRPFDLGALVEKVVRENGAGMPERFGTDVEDVLPLALGDEQRNWQVLTNLLSNAVKFSPPGSPITVSVERVGDLLQVSVTDQGPGIAPEDQARLFRKFKRVAGEGTKLVPGTGLGLYICKSIVEAQGGTIWVDSAPGEGATFLYTVPAQHD